MFITRTHRTEKQPTVVHAIAILMFVVSIFGLANIPRAGVSLVIPEPKGGSQKITIPCSDTISCLVAPQVLKTSDYLMRNKNSQGITPDPRNIQPYSEYVRLNIVTQAGGYLNLYEATGKQVYLQEAQSRLGYMANSMQLGSLTGGPFDGMMGYVFLQGGQDLHNAYFRSKGLQLADSCLTMPYLTLDPGYMCDMVLAKAYNITNDVRYVNKLRESTAETATRQYSSGGFPHWNQKAGASANYTAWMIEESYMIRQSDPMNPDLDTTILNSRNFLKGLVNADGSLHKVPGEPDGVGISTLSSISYALQGLGENATAQNVLQFLFRKQFTGVNSGAYADGWENDNPNDYWTVTEPSVLRTSLVFWDLSNILTDKKFGQCVSGATTSCIITPNNCSGAFASINACNQNYSGMDTCIDGSQTKCLNTQVIVMQPALCQPLFVQCISDRQYLNCGTVGLQRCAGTNCGVCVPGDSGEIACTPGTDDYPPEQCYAK